MRVEVEAELVGVVDVRRALGEAAESLLGKAREGAGPLVARIETEVVESLGARVSEVIVDEAQRWGANLIVLGTHGRRGVPRVLMGSDAEQTRPDCTGARAPAALIPGSSRLPRPQPGLSYRPRLSHRFK